ncbi:MAG: NAD(+) diphosphatase [Gammaproteobacteria bacterium]|nr:NAD(+) diphosphatase [Gammaproteobacteria bacterium]
MSTQLWPRDPGQFISLPKSEEPESDGDSMYFTVMAGELLSILEAGIPRPVTADEFMWLDVEVKHKMFLGTLRGKNCYVLSATGSVPKEYVLSPLRSWLGRVEPDMFYLAGRSVQLIEWLQNHRYCGRCGEPTKEDNNDRALVCPSCNLVSYPRLSPSIIVLVRKGKQALLARNRSWQSGFFSTLAGFVEPGESIEQTVHREVKEEVGIEVTNLRYLGSQSWPFPNSLMLGFHADYLSGEFHYRDGEISEARWFDIDDFPNIPGGTAISRWLIDEFVQEVRG